MRVTVRLLVLCCLLPGALQAADNDRARIAAERKAMAERFAAEEKACASRFAVTACVDEVRARRREALAPLRERELKLEEAERQVRAQERRQDIARRQADALQRGPAPPEPEAHVRQPLLGASATARGSRTPDDGAGRAAAAERRLQEARLRQGDAQATQERIDKRQAERDAQRKKAKPLPVPAPQAASSPR